LSTKKKKKLYMDLILFSYQSDTIESKIKIWKWYYYLALRRKKHASSEEAVAKILGWPRRNYTAWKKEKKSEREEKIEA